MATLRVIGDELQVRFTKPEKVFGLVRDHDVPLSAVVSATVATDGLHAVHGIRAPGLGVPGRRKVGTWRGRGRTLVSVRRGRPALVAELRGEHFDRLVVETDDGLALLGRLRRG
ncbi:MAG: hypothetical protein ACXVWU_03115 [Nocardioides sp.]